MNSQSQSPKYYYEKPCRNFERFLELISGIKDKWWIFRGQTDARRELSSKLERVCQRFNVRPDMRKSVEANMIREFQRRLHQYTSIIPQVNANDEWMSIMQHHGAPTRLIDFSYSPYVAAYFAFEKAEPGGKVAIWAINANWCDQRLQEMSPELYKQCKTYRDYRDPAYFNNLFMSGKREHFALAVNPFRLNERLSYQRGVFLCPGDITAPLSEILTNYTENQSLEDKIVKYTIPAGLKNEITERALKELDLMNINRITLFPGLDGFAQSFEVRTVTLFTKQKRRPTLDQPPQR